jgi:hypothetical protein
LKLNKSFWVPGGNKISSTLLKGGIPANASREFEGNATLNDPDRWDVNHGVLYTLHTIVRKGSKVLDEYSTPFGVRSIRITADDGFYLNDRRVQLKEFVFTMTRDRSVLPFTPRYGTSIGIAEIHGMQCHPDQPQLSCTRVAGSL